VIVVLATPLGAAATVLVKKFYVEDVLSKRPSAGN
jgi:hypothetical protein